ncbi:MAG: hypothetical protein IV092_23960 [Burkholderiaceae bacterium]|nr:hypothetical protein [Burkholderiaceae bacterium]
MRKPQRGGERPACVTAAAGEAGLAALLEQAQQLLANGRGDAARLVIAQAQARLGNHPPPSAEPTAAPVRVTLLGGLQLRLQGRVLADRDWHGSRGQLLLKALVVLGGQQISTQRLCDLLWPDADGARAQQNLRVALWRLRRTGATAGSRPPPWLTLQQGQVSLSTTLCEIDALDFAKTPPEADSARLDQALALYRGPFLAGDDSAPWIIDHRRRLARHYVRLVQARAELALARQGTALARCAALPQHLERALEVDALDPHTLSLLMQWQLRCGQPVPALRAFAQFERGVRQQLGVAPGEALLRLAATARARCGGLDLAADQSDASTA